LPVCARRRTRVPEKPGQQCRAGHDRARPLQRHRARSCRFRQTGAGKYAARVHRGLVFALSLLIVAPAAAAARSQATIQASPTTGAAPLRVTFTAAGTTSLHWDFGDGTSADGLTVEHVYAAGRWTATATDSDASSESVVITAYGLTLRGPRTAPYGRRTVFRGSLVPAEAGVRVTLAGPSGKVG